VERGLLKSSIAVNFFFLFFRLFLGSKIVLWSECFLLCMHLVRISVLWFKHVRLSASRINNFSVMQVSQNLAPGKYIPVFALTFHCISGWIFLSFRLQTCFESLVGFLPAVFLFLSAPRCSVYHFLNVLPVIPMYIVLA
jgi:hypothetical protein